MAGISRKNTSTKIHVNESVIRQLLREIAVTGDVTAGQDGMDDIKQGTTLGSAVPISASQQSPTQLSVDRPPIEDPQYIPSSSKELGYAIQAMCEVVPEDKVKEVYLDFIRRVNAGFDGPVSEASLKGPK